MGGHFFPWVSSVSFLDYIWESMQNLSHVGKRFVEYIGRKESQPFSRPIQLCCLLGTRPVHGGQSRSLQLEPVTQAS